MFVQSIDKIAGLTLSENEPMKKHTAFGVGGTADYYAEVDSLYTLNALMQKAEENKIPYKIIGLGSNLLVSDKGFKGIIINTRRLNDVFFKRDYVRAMAGATVEKLVKFTVEHSLVGMEKLSGLPATLGGAIAMNAGAFGASISDCIVEVETLSDGKIKKYYKTDCKFSYRSSKFLHKKEAIVSATFDFSRGEREDIVERMRLYNELRKQKQPQGRSCGSVFKNPKAKSAGELIDECGLKGCSIGNAKVSEKHANFIITSSGATATDVYRLITLIKEKIQNVFGVTLNEEVEYLGEF